MNQCVNCRFHEKTSGYAIMHICNNPKASVIGPPIWCSDARKDDGLCKSNGILFDPLENHLKARSGNV